MNIYRLLRLIVIFLFTDQAVANGELNVAFTRYVTPLLKTNTAKHQLSTETSHRHFDVVYMQANQQWHRYLSRVDIAAPSEQKVVFYTELYNVLIQSNQNSDADNHYSDRNEEAHHPADDKQSATMRL